MAKILIVEDDKDIALGLEEDLVVAPYASLLAISLEPQETIRNLQRLNALGLFNDYGFYEAIDFSRQRRREGERRGCSGGGRVLAGDGGPRSRRQSDPGQRG